MTRAQPVDVHRPKVEYFNVAELTNIDPKGYVRQVERFHVEPWGLYMARTADHAQFDYLESWLLPSLSLRATVFHFRPEFTRDQDYYLDIGEFTQMNPDQWRSLDHYLDLVVRTERETVLLDVDELFAAHTAGLIDTAAAETAVATATRAIDGIAANGHDFQRWVHGMGMPLAWL